jgi:hypothetical protein
MSGASPGLVAAAVPAIRRPVGTRVPRLLAHPATLEAACLAALAAILASQLLWPPIVGLADIGDYPRVMGWFRLDYVSRSARSASSTAWPTRAESG